MAGFTVTRRGFADGRGERSGQLAANSVNTGKLLLSATGKDPSLTTDFHNAFTFPNYTALSTQDDYAISPGSVLPDGTIASSAKTIYQLASGVYNTGTQNTVALSGFARGQNVWGINTVTMADSATNNAIAIAEEHDFGVQQAGSQCDGLGLHIHFGDGTPGGNAAHAFVITSRGSGIPDVKTGICAGLVNSIALTVNGAQAPDTAGHLTVSSGALGLGSNNQFVYGGNRFKFTTPSIDTDVPGITLLEGTPGMTIPNGAQIYVGNQPYPTVGGTVMNVSGFVQAPTGIDFSHLLATYADLWLGVNTSTGATGVMLEPRQGLIAQGVGMQLIPDSSATAYPGASLQYGRRVSAGAVDASGTLDFVAPLTTVALASNGQVINQTPATINVGTTGGFVTPASGTVRIGGIAVTYTSKTATAFVGCTIASGSITLVTSQQVSIPAFRGIDLSGGYFTDSAINVGDNNIRAGSITGVQIATATTQKLGFYGGTPITQPTAATNVHTVAAGATTNVFTNTTFDGSVGSTAYTVGDLVAALKHLNLIAQ